MHVGFIEILCNCAFISPIFMSRHLWRLVSTKVLKKVKKVNVTYLTIQIIFYCMLYTFNSEKEQSEI